MLSATLICTDEVCAEEYEAWSDADDLEASLCPGCACVLQAIAFSEVEPLEVSSGRATGTPAELPRAA